ncbi:MAG TPA: tRNA nucleotidyltransferase, partial [Saprospiraceae bacterium]|nr:tRNA nucleotidyltransferase [Saprospiraceae bacterium]
MIISIQPYEREIFTLIGETSAKLGYPSYVIGGFVRDRLLARNSKDIDIVCIGDGIKLAEQVSYRLRPIPRIVVYKRFGTAMLK